MSITKSILKAIDDFKNKLKYIPDLEIVGNPIGSVVAIKFKRHPERIYKVRARQSSVQSCLDNFS